MRAAMLRLGLARDVQRALVDRRADVGSAHARHRHGDVVRLGILGERVLRHSAWEVEALALGGEAARRVEEESIHERERVDSEHCGVCVLVLRVRGCCAPESVCVWTSMGQSRAIQSSTIYSGEYVKTDRNTCAATS